MTEQEIKGQIERANLSFSSQHSATYFEGLGFAVYYNADWACWMYRLAEEVDPESGMWSGTDKGELTGFEILERILAASAEFEAEGLTSG